MSAQAPSSSLSLLLRRLVLAAQWVPLLALARTAGIWLPALLAGAGMALGHWYSARPTSNQGRLPRLLMFVMLHVAFCGMCVGLTQGMRYPQAQFAIYAQVITSFDLRKRRNLFSTLVHSLLNLYVAATLSRTVELGLYLLLFAGLALAAFFVSEYQEGQEGARLLPDPPPPSEAPRPTPLLWLGLRYGLLAALAIFVAFLFTPRFASRPIIPPFSITVPQRGGVKSEIINPGVPLVQVNGWSDGTSDYYYGFDSNLDLRYRGGLSNEIIMYVSSPSRSYWRSHSYDFYDGVRWSQSDDTLFTLRGRISFEVPYDEQALSGQEIFQTYTIVRDQPNLIFAAYRPAEIYMAATQLAIDAGAGIRSPEPLAAGTTYSVLSYRPDFDPATLREARGPLPDLIEDRYLQLPDSISARVRELARELAEPHDNDFDRVAALNEHLLTSYAYNFFPPPHPPGAEVVDNFLFVDQEGVCEQYVTALVVMARSLGIPARLVAGYGSGDYNRLTGYYEVSANDAHAWAEIYFPGHGWVPFDPTPGWEPRPYPTPVQEWFLSGSTLLDWELPIGGLLSAGATGASLLAPYLIGALSLFLVILLTLRLNTQLRARLAARLARRYSRLDDGAQRSAILRLYRRGVALLARRGRKRGEGETLGEYAAQHPSPALARLTESAEIAAYRPTPPDEETLQQAQAALQALQQEARRKKE